MPPTQKNKTISS